MRALTRERNPTRGTTPGHRLALGLAAAALAVASNAASAAEPGVVMDVSVDASGDRDRAGFLVEARNGKQEVRETLPALGAK